MAKLKPCPRPIGYVFKKNTPPNAVVSFYPVACGRWSCAECAALMSSAWKHALARQIDRLNLPNWCFITLTLPSASSNFALRRQALYMSAKWHVLHQLLKRRATALNAETASFHYVRVLEVHKSHQRVHLHILAGLVMPDGDIYTPNTAKNRERLLQGKHPFQRSHTLNRVLRRVGLGYMHEIHYVNDPLSAALYITKYITKSMTSKARVWERLKGIRRISTSRSIKSPATLKVSNPDYQYIPIDDLEYEISKLDERGIRSKVVK